MTPVIIIILKSTAVGKYARRPLNHAVQELSLKALARRIVLHRIFQQKNQIMLGQYNQCAR